MDIKEISNNIDRILWNNKKLPYNNELYLRHIGVDEDNYPIIYKVGLLEMRVIALKRNCRVYCEVLRNGKEVGSCWAMHTDLPPKTIKDIYKLIKNY